MGHIGPGNNGNEGLLHIPQISMARTLSSDDLMSYLGHSLGKGSYSSAQIQLVYITAPADWAY